VQPLVDRVTEQRFRALVAEVADPVRRYLWRRTDPTTAEDVLAETLVVLWRRFDDPPHDAVPWAIGIARNVLANAQRAAARRDRLAARIAALDPPPVAAPEVDDDEDREVRRVLALLKPADAEVLRLWAWEHLEPRGIGKVLGISANAAAVRLHRARRRFEQAFGKNRRDAEQVEVKGESR
jgi:RNA polymerase sigma-70 factor (ECF subfamily)